MSEGTFARTVFAGILLAGTAWNNAIAQRPLVGTLYVFHSEANGGCPTLDWHVVLGENGALNGMISWDNMKSMARVSGTMNAYKDFSMTATEIGGAGRTAAITGTVRPTDGWLIADVKGVDVNCKKITVPIFHTGKGGG
jgi:hypothetical protein